MKKNILIIILIILTLILFFFRDNRSNKLQQETISVYDWNMMPEYDYSPEDSLIKVLGEPNNSSLIKITGEGSLGPQMYLHRYLSSFKDTIYFRQLVWQQNDYKLYIWFKKRDSVWMSVYGVKYDPDKVQF